MVRKKILLPLVALVLLGGTLYGASAVSAHFGGDDGTFAQKLAEKLGVSQEQVEQAFAELRDEHQVDRQAMIEDKLDQAVSDGQITQEQKQLILDKHAELRAQHDELKDKFKDLSSQERRAAMDSMHDELETWADENGIDLELFSFGPAPHMDRHRMRF